MNNANIDTKYLIYPDAPFEKRILASLLDGLITFGLLLPSLLLLFTGVGASISGSNGGILLMLGVLLFLMPLIYSLVKDGLNDGQSFGKKAVGLMVVYLPTNTPCTIKQSCMRRLKGLAFSKLMTAPLDANPRGMPSFGQQPHKSLLFRDVGNMQVIEKKYYI
jgi:uncharacterized RDD family membrane protein YckC